MDETVTRLGAPGLHDRQWAPPPADALVAAAFVVMTIVEAVFSPGVSSPVAHLVGSGLAMATLAWRRRFPLAVAAIVVASNVVLNPEGQFSVLLSLVLVSFTVGFETEPPRSYVGLVVLVVPFLIVSAVEGLEPSDVAAALVFFAGPWVVGVASRQRSARAQEAVARSERLEREHAAQAAAAVVEERTRIARELHDIVSHSLSVVTIQTQAVRKRLGPDNAREADDLAAVEATARDALAEMRRLFGVLRSDGEAASLAPQPGLEQVAPLLDQVRGSGIEVTLSVEGDSYALPPGIDLAAYRIVQEGLTNALRHAGAKELAVTLRFRPKELEIVVEDDGRGLAEPRSQGHGLVGVRERVALYGGSVEISTPETGGVRLRATLPVREGG